MRVVAGIDFSMSCPGLCIHEGDSWSHQNCHFFYLFKTKKWLRNSKQILSAITPDSANDAARINWTIEWLMSNIIAYPGIEVYIENYSYTSGSSSTHILAEGTGVLKNRLFLQGIEPVLFSPGTIKKFATGKGNATKESMWRSHQAEKSWLSEELPCPEGKSPLADLIDAYYIAKLGFTTSGNV